MSRSLDIRQMEHIINKDTIAIDFDGMAFIAGNDNVTVHITSDEAKTLSIQLSQLTQAIETHKQNFTEDDFLKEVKE